MDGMRPEDLEAIRRMAARVMENPPNPAAAQRAAETARRIQATLTDSRIADRLDFDVDRLVEKISAAARASESYPAMAEGISRMLETASVGVASQVRANPEPLLALARVSTEKPAAEDAAEAELKTVLQEALDGLAEDEVFEALFHEASAQVASNGMDADEWPVEIDERVAAAYVSFCAAIVVLGVLATNPFLAAIIATISTSRTAARVVYDFLRRRLDGPEL